MLPRIMNCHKSRGNSLLITPKETYPHHSHCLLISFHLIFFKNHITFYTYFTYLLFNYAHQNACPKRQGLSIPCSPVYPQRLEQSLLYTSCSIDACQMNEWLPSVPTETKVRNIWYTSALAFLVAD